MVPEKSDDDLLSSFSKVAVALFKNHISVPFVAS